MQSEFDTFVLEEAAKSLRNIFVFSMQQPPIAIDHRHLAAEPTHRLRKFEPYGSTTNHKEVHGMRPHRIWIAHPVLSGLRSYAPDPGKTDRRRPRILYDPAP